MANHVVISEVYADAIDETAPGIGEFVELYNPTSSAIVMTNWKIIDNDGWSTTFSGTIPAYGFFVIAINNYNASTNSTEAGWPAWDVNCAVAPTLANGGDEVCIQDGSGNLVDVFGYGATAENWEGTKFPTIALQGQSYERKSGPTHDNARGNGYDTNNNANDFYIRGDTVTTTTEAEPQNTSSPSEPPYQVHFEKVCMPDLGQHSASWCWCAAAANSIYWYSQHGYPELIDDPADPTPNDNRYITDPLRFGPGDPTGYYRLLDEIASDCGHVFCEGILNNEYFSGLQKFIMDQGAPLRVHEIVDPALSSIPPSGPNVEYRLPTLVDYQRELENCQDVLLWLNYRHTYPEYEDTDHVVTGVGFWDNSWIVVSDPWSTGAPDHNNGLENKRYDNLMVLSAPNAPLLVRYEGIDNIQVSKMVYISPAPPVVCGVEVTIENKVQEGWPSQVLQFTVSVHNSGNVVDNFVLTPVDGQWPQGEIWIDPQRLEGIPPCGIGQATLYVHVPDGTPPSTYKDITVIAESQFCGASDSDIVTVHVVEAPYCGVDITIITPPQEGTPCTYLKYTIDVHNSGNVVDNIMVGFIPDGWDMDIDPKVHYDVMPCEHRQSILTVHVSENAVKCYEKYIEVWAESQFCHATDYATTFAHATENLPPHDNWFEKVCMPDLGQHAANWCWVGSVANCFWWYAQNGYPELIDDPADPTPNDNRYITDPLVPDPGVPTCPGHYRLFEEIAADCGGGWNTPVTDNALFYGLKKFIKDQGLENRLEVHEIITPGYPPEGKYPIEGPNPPMSENGIEWRPPTFEDYKRELSRCQDVLLVVDWDCTNPNHMVTGVGFLDDPAVIGDEWIRVSDPWTTGAPDHNNIKENKIYDNCKVVTTDPFRITIQGRGANVVKMVIISPIVEPWTGTAVFKLENLYKVSLKKDLQINTGSKLVVKFYKYDNTPDNQSVIDNFVPPVTILENENVPHPSGLVPVERVRLVLTTDDTANEISTIASFTVTKSVLANRYLAIKIEYVKPGADKPALANEYLKIKTQYIKAPS